MRRLLRILPLLLLIAVLSMLMFARAIPSTKRLERQILIYSPHAQVFKKLGQIREWEGWYVPPGVGKFEGPKVGPPGTLSVYDETTKQSVSVQLTFTSSTSIKYKFPDRNEAPFDIEGEFQIEIMSPNKVKVTSIQRLASRSENSSYIAMTGERWFLYVFADRFIGSIMQKELSNLKTVTEGGSIQVNPLEN